MSQYQYRVVPFIGQLKSGVFSVENAGKVSQQLQDLINQYATDDWEFYRIDKVDIQVSAGCMAGLFGAKSGIITFDQVIFRRAMA